MCLQCLIDVISMFLQCFFNVKLGKHWRNIEKTSIKHCKHIVVIRPFWRNIENTLKKHWKNIENTLYFYAPSEETLKTHWKHIVVLAPFGKNIGITLELHWNSIVFTLFLHGHFGPKTLETHRKNIEITSKIPFITRIAMFFQCFFNVKTM